MRESSPSIAKNLIFRVVFYKRIFIQFINYFLVQIKENQAIKYKRSFVLIIAQLQQLFRQSINRQRRSFDQKWELI